ncbi:MAG: NADH-ubiquinone oxidoreductase chain G2; Formate dehydrogenase putative subunit, partial [uncultured Actinomycetospora sp.]
DGDPTPGDPGGPRLGQGAGRRRWRLGGPARRPAARRRRRGRRGRGRRRRRDVRPPARRAHRRRHPPGHARRTHRDRPRGHRAGPRGAGEHRGGDARDDPPPGLAHPRRPRGAGARGRDDPRRPARRGHTRAGRHPDDLLGPQHGPDQRVPGVRGRGRGLPHARPVVRAPMRGRHGGQDRHREGQAQPAHGAGAARVVGGHGPRHRRRAALDDRLRRRHGALRPARSPGRGRRARPSPPGAPPRPRRGHGGHRAPAGQGRQRPLRARLLALRPLLQVRQRVRQRRPVHVRDHRGRARVRRPHRHRVRRHAAGVGVRVLRQLHRRVPHRGADLAQRVRAARGRRLAPRGADDDHHHLLVLRGRVQPRAARPAEPDRQRHEPRRPLGDPRAPVHQGPVRVPARAEPV